jgi:hypothetical protein
MELAYARITVMTMMTLTFEYDHIHPRLFSTQRLPSATLDHQDNMSLALMILSIGMARYLSGIRPMVLLFSSSIRYTGLNILPNAGSL